MFILRSLPIVAAFVASVSSSVGFAAECQRWSVLITGNNVAVQASAETQFKFVQVTVTALQEAGLEHFTFRIQKPNYEIGEDQRAFSIQIVDGTAEITASRDLPYKYVVAALNALKKVGVSNITVGVAGESTGEAASR